MTGFCLRAGRPVRDVTLISCNNEQPWLAGLRPRPATIDLGAKTTGRCAAEQLLWRIRCPEKQRRIQVLVEPVLITDAPGSPSGGRLRST